MPIGPNINIRVSNGLWYAGSVMAAGGVVVQTSAPTTDFYGDKNAVVGYAADPTTGVRPIGLLFHEVVARPETTGVFINPQKEGFTQYVNQKVELVQSGEVETDFIPSGVTTIVPGSAAYLAADGKVSNVQAGTSPNQAPRIGTWLTPKNAKGRAIVRIELV